MSSGFFFSVLCSGDRITQSIYYTPIQFFCDRAVRVFCPRLIDYAGFLLAHLYLLDSIVMIWEGADAIQDTILD